MTSDAADAGALAGRVVLVTGAHGGLGAAASLACAQAGATVVLLGRKLPKLNRLHDRIVAQGGGTLPAPVLYPLDMQGATPDDYAQMVERIEGELGRLDGVLHCAVDFTGLTPLLLTDPAVFARSMHVDLTARWWLTQACLPLLQRGSDGAVVFVIDEVARSGAAYWGAYGLAQAAQVALVGMLHAETANSTLRVSALQPGPMRTALRGRAYTEEDDTTAADPSLAAQACVTLLSAAGVVHRGTTWRPRA